MTRSRRLLLGSALALMAVAGPSCESVNAPEPGTLSVSLTTPNTGDAGILFTVFGTVTDVSVSGSSYTLFSRLGSGEARVLVFGNLQTGPVVTIDVPDVGAVASYSATVLDVIGRSNDVRSSHAGYEITFAKGTAGL